MTDAGPATHSPFSMQSHTGWLINRINFRRAERLKEVLEPWGLSARAAGVLKAVSELPQPVAQSEICAALVLDQASVAVLAEQLEKDGLIERRRDPRNRRRYIVTLTEQGLRVHEQAAAASAGVEQELVGFLDAPQADELHALLTTVARHNGIID